MLQIICVVGLVSANAVIGTNIGGWQVLEPWITPSLFYKFLNKTRDDGVGMDSYTFCDSFDNATEANRWMRAHWQYWFNETHMDELAARQVQRVRLPIGDWTINQYGPYIGCMDGAAEQIDQLLDWAAARNISVWMDVHTARGSQNGFDNGGRAQLVTWAEDGMSFEHNGDAEWLGLGDSGNANFAHLKWSLDQVEALLQRWGSHSALIGFEPVNEPEYVTNINVLKMYYREARKLVQRYAPQAYFVFHNSFRKEWGYWSDLFAEDDRSMTAVDHHGYFAWQSINTVQDACDFINKESVFALDFRENGIEVWWGEWSLATDNCALWLGGFNDGYPNAECKPVECPYSYLPADEFDTTFDRTSIEPLGPRSSADMSKVGVTNGTCWDDSAKFSTEEVDHIAKCTLAAFNERIDATFLWTAHNEIEAKWSYVEAWDKGWIDQRDQLPQQDLSAKSFIQ